MKKLIVLLLTFVLLGCSVACAEQTAVERVGSGADGAMLTRQAVYMLDEATGAWTAQTYQTEALLDWFWESGNRNDSPVVLTVELEGNAETGLMTPVLRIYRLLGKNAQSVQAASVLVDGVRYDFAVVRTTIQRGGDQAEVLSAPLDSESLHLIDALIACDTATVRLMGDKTVTEQLSAEGKTVRQKIGYAGLTGMVDAKALLLHAGVYEYGLWDLNAAAWEMAHGAVPMFQTGAADMMIGSAETEDAFGMVLPGETGAAVEEAQRLLCAEGFMAGDIGKRMDARAVAAVIRAQKHYGMIPTGCMDGRLAKLLTAGAAVETAAVSATEGMQIGGVIQISLERWWVADAVQAKYAMQADRTASNRDRCLVVADGWMGNLSNEAIRFMIDAKATLVLDGEARYDATLVCECDGGERLDTQLLAREAARVIVYAELPQQLLNDEAAAWTLEVTAGGETATFVLK